MGIQIAIEYWFIAIQLLQPLIGAEELESEFQQSICYFFGLGVPKSNSRAIDAFRSSDFSSYNVEISDLDRQYF